MTVAQIGPYSRPHMLREDGVVRAAITVPLEDEGEDERPTLH